MHRLVSSLAVAVAFAAGCGSHRLQEVDAPAASTGKDAAAAVPDPTCAAPGCLRRALKIGDYDRATLQAMVDPRLTVDNGYTVWTIEYVTGARTSLATVTIPFASVAPATGYAIVANNHGTTGLDDPCAISGTVLGAGLAGLFGARGMIGIASDYPGLGTDGLHPYLVRDVEGKAVLDALRAASALAMWQGVPISGRYASVGMSQGGHATLAAAMLHASYAPELDIRGFAAAAPASLFASYWQAGMTLDGPHVPYHAMLVYAWMQHYGYAGPSPWLAGQEATIASALTHDCIAPMNGTGAIADVLGVQRAAIFTQEFIDAYASGTWGPYAAFSGWFDTNRLGAYAQSAPVQIYQGDADTVVSEASTSELVATLRTGGVQVGYEVVPGGTHTDVAFGYLASYELRTEASIAWVRARVDP
jgi:dienelactone hydrolase